MGPGAQFTYQQAHTPYRHQNSFEKNGKISYCVLCVSTDVSQHQALAPPTHGPAGTKRPPTIPHLTHLGARTICRVSFWSRKAALTRLLSPPLNETFLPLHMLRELSRHRCTGDPYLAVLFLVTLLPFLIIAARPSICLPYKYPVDSRRSVWVCSSSLL
jgi:hypothetical protein